MPNSANTSWPRLGFWINGHPWISNKPTEFRAYIWALCLERGKLDGRTIFWWKSDGSCEMMPEGVQWLAEDRKAGRL